MRAVLLSALFSSALTAAITAVVVTQLQSSVARAQPVGPIAASSFYLVKDGNVRAELSVDDHDEVRLAMYGVTGHDAAAMGSRLTIAANAAGTSIDMSGASTYDTQGNAGQGPSIVIWTTPGRPLIELFTAGGTEVWRAPAS